MYSNITKAKQRISISCCDIHNFNGKFYTKVLKHCILIIPDHITYTISRLILSKYIMYSIRSFWNAVQKTSDRQYSNRDSWNAPVTALSKSNYMYHLSWHGPGFKNTQHHEFLQNILYNKVSFHLKKKFTKVASFISNLVLCNTNHSYLLGSYISPTFSYCQ